MAKPYPGRIPFCAALCLSHILWIAPLVAQEQRDPQEFLLAIGLIQRDMPEEAVGHLESFLDEFPRHRRTAEAWYRLGNCRIGMAEPEAAIASFRKALQFDDLRLRGECRYKLGTTLQGQAELEPALQQFLAILSENDSDYYLMTASRYAAGEVQRDLGQDRAALAQFLAAAEGAGKEEEFAFSGLYQAGFVLMRLGENAPAFATFGEIAERFPKHEAIAEIYYLLGEAAFRGEQIDRAGEAWQRCLQSPSEHADDALNGLAWCQIERGDKPEAMNLFRRLLSEHPDSELAGSARLELGRLLHQTGDHQGAVAELGILLGSEDLAAETRSTALELRGLALLETGAGDDAMQSFESALASGMGEADSLRLQYHLGDTLMAKQEFKLAYAAYEKAATAEDAGLRGDALYAQSLALHKLGLYADSAERAQQLLDDHPQHRLTDLARFALAENSFALQDYADARDRYDGLNDDHAMIMAARFKGSWATYLAGEPGMAAERFAGIAADQGQSAEVQEESLSMQALCLHEAGDQDAALAAADRYLARYPDGNFLDRTERIAGRVLKQKGDLKGAAVRLAKAASSAESGDQAAELRLEEADVLFGQGDFEAARRLYAGLAERSDRSGARALVGLAWCAFELGDRQNCLLRAEAALAHAEVGDEAAGVLELMVTVHHQAERWQDAATQAERYLAVFPEHARAAELRYALGLSQARGGDLEAARRTLVQLVEKGGCQRQDRVQYELAWVCRRIGDEPAALAAFTKVVEISEDIDLAGESSLHLGEAAIASGEPEQARAHFAKVEGQSRGRALYRIGFSWLDAAQPAKATQAFEAVVELGADEGLFLEASFMAAESRIRIDQHDRALVHLRRLLAADPEHERAQRSRLLLGECQVRAGAPAEAIAHLQDFLRIGRADDDDSPLSRVERARGQLWIGKARQARGEQAMAEKAFLEVTRLSEGEMAAEAQYRIGETREAREDLNGAVDAFVKLSILYAHEPWVPDGLWQAGQCFERLDQRAKAQKFYKELIERYPESDAGEKARNKVRGV